MQLNCQINQYTHSLRYFIWLLTYSYFMCWITIADFVHTVCLQIYKYAITMQCYKCVYMFLLLSMNCTLNCFLWFLVMVLSGYFQFYLCSYVWIKFTSNNAAGFTFATIQENIGQLFNFRFKRFISFVLNYLSNIYLQLYH